MQTIEHDDFQDDGASFRVRRERQLADMYRPKPLTGFRYYLRLFLRSILYSFRLIFYTMIVAVMFAMSGLPERTPQIPEWGWTLAAMACGLFGCAVQYRHSEKKRKRREERYYQIIS